MAGWDGHFTYSGMEVIELFTGLEFDKAVITDISAVGVNKHIPISEWKGCLAVCMCMATNVRT